MTFRAFLVALATSIFACTPQPVDNRTDAVEANANANVTTPPVIPTDNSTLNPDLGGDGCDADISSFVVLVQNNCKACHEAGAGLPNATVKFAVSSTDRDLARQAIETEVAQLGGGAAFFDWLTDSRHPGASASSALDATRATNESVLDNCFQ